MCISYCCMCITKKCSNISFLIILSFVTLVTFVHLQNLIVWLTIPKPGLDIIFWVGANSSVWTESRHHLCWVPCFLGQTEVFEPSSDMICWVPGFLLQTEVFEPSPDIISWVSGVLGQTVVFELDPDIICWVSGFLVQTEVLNQAHTSLVECLVSWCKQ